VRSFAGWRHGASATAWPPSSSGVLPEEPGDRRREGLDVALEAWAIFVVTALAGSFATFLQTGDAEG